VDAARPAATWRSAARAKLYSVGTETDSSSRSGAGTATAIFSVPPDALELRAAEQRGRSREPLGSLGA
jgi:hypothetical protein